MGLFTYVKIDPSILPAKYRHVTGWQTKDVVDPLLLCITIRKDRKMRYNGSQIYYDGIFGIRSVPDGVELLCTAENGFVTSCDIRYDEESGNNKMNDNVINLDLEATELAMKFHEFYEQLAPQFGYETRPDTKQFDPKSNNGQLMIETCRKILEWQLRPMPADGDDYTWEDDGGIRLESDGGEITIGSQKSGFDAVREKYGHYFDDIEDVDTYVQNIRYDTRTFPERHDEQIAAIVEQMRCIVKRIEKIEEDLSLWQADD